MYSECVKWYCDQGGHSLDEKERLSWSEATGLRRQSGSLGDYGGGHMDGVEHCPSGDRGTSNRRCRPSGWEQ
jgi:hypothetical protein